MPDIEPIPGAPAAIASLPGERALIVADYHAGLEYALRYERGVELDSGAQRRRDRLISLLSQTDADRVIVLGDLAHRIAAPEGEELDELEMLIEDVTARVPMTLVQGNHDPGVATEFADQLDVRPAGGCRIGNIGFAHGHTWPRAEVLAADTLCAGHEHPQVQLSDTVGGTRTERAWLRGSLEMAGFAEDVSLEDIEWRHPELILFPAFNERSGGTKLNIDGGDFLSPYLPGALDTADSYLMDGTRLGPFRQV